jgi:hypothetical protein
MGPSGKPCQLHTRMSTAEIEQEWYRCMSIWRHIGRVEDFPRNERRPKYLPSQPTEMARKFSKDFLSQWEFLVARLTVDDETERLCAFECLEYMFWELLEARGVPEELLVLEDALPAVIVEELKGDAEAKGFEGKTVGAWFTHLANQYI